MIATDRTGEGRHPSQRHAGGDGGDSIVGEQAKVKELAFYQKLESQNILVQFSPEGSLTRLISPHLPLYWRWETRENLLANNNRLQSIGVLVANLAKIVDAV